MHDNITNNIIDENIPLGIEEQAENLLKELYGGCQIEGTMTVGQLETIMDIDKSTIIVCLQELSNQGHVHMIEDWIELTTFGKARGAEYVERHKGLTQFIQTVCNVGEVEAKENACRVEHVISKKVMQGFYDFIRFGNSYEREVSNTNLKLRYREGSYVFVMGIYMPERRFPRVLSSENSIFKQEVELNITKKKSCFYIHKRKEYKKNIWYLHNGEWKLAVVTTKGIRIPTEVFRFSVDMNDPIIEGKAIVAFSTCDTMPRGDYRELNIHMW